MKTKLGKLHCICVLSPYNTLPSFLLLLVADGTTPNFKRLTRETLETLAMGLGYQFELYLVFL